MDNGQMGIFTQHTQLKCSMCRKDSSCYIFNSKYVKDNKIESGSQYIYNIKDIEKSEQEKIINACINFKVNIR